MNTQARWHRVRELFVRSLDQCDAARDVWLKKECSGDDPLLADIRRLLAQRSSPASIFRDDAEALLTKMAVQPDSDARLDTDIGPYRLRKLLGVGGMGRVYLAERTDGQFSQQVALKLVRNEFSTNELHQRFLRERNTLARLAHPNIAQLHDGGVANGGAPYFTLEYIEGEPITRWCDARACDVRTRVSLMLKVCDAVLHAHRNLIVHRDLKPSNILVNADGEPKLLDFGIAKPLAETAAMETLTNADARPMTREYAAPEQLLGDPVTTATDIYALGVLLYFLLSGHMPYRRAELGETSWIKAILEDAPEPAERAIDRKDAAEIARARSTTPTALKRALRGDLERIMQRALAKRAESRYATADKLADDLRAYLAGRAISGGTRTYRMRKFARRHWLPLSVGAVLLAVVLSGTVAMAWQARRIAAEARTTDAVKNFLVGLFRDADSTQTNGKEVTARELVDRGAARLGKMTGEPLLRGELNSVLGEIYNDLGRSNEAETAERAAIDDLQTGGAAAPLIAASERERARAESDLQRDEEAAHDAALATARLLQAGAPPADMARSLQMQATVEISRHRFDDAKRFIDEAEQFARRPQVSSDVLADCLGTASVVAWALHDVEGGAALAREQIALLRAGAGENDPSAAVAEGQLADIIDVVHPREALELDQHALSVLEPAVGAADQRVLDIKILMLPRLAWFGRYDEAERRVHEVEAVVRASPTPNQLELQDMLNFWGQLEFLREDYAAAEQKIVELIDVDERRFGKDSSITDAQLFFRAFLRGLQGHLDDAARELDEISVRRTSKGRPLPSNWLLMRGVIDVRRGEYAAAEKELREGVGRDEAMFHGGSVWTAQSKSVLATALMGEGRDDEAENLLRDSLRMENEMFGEPVPERARTLLNLAHLLARQPQRHAEARAVAAEAAQIFSRFLGEQNPHAREAAALAQADAAP
ncbi:MAG TPA: serine/threonine-protein kinase [Paraburkholderia sp.]|nr:serine/threonine-protein kinase [Paraburkholderia sp.]